MSYQWTAEEEALLRILRPINSYTEIAVQFEKMCEKRLPGFRVPRSSDAIRRKCNRDGITEDTIVNPMEEYEERWAEIKRISNEYIDAHIQTTNGLLEGGARRKILSLSDTHFPFCRVADVAEALRVHADADIVVLNGDLFDGEVFSSFGSAKRIAALKEYKQVFSLVEYCSENFPQVVLTHGNHDYRPAGALKRSDFPEEASQIFRPDLLARVANGEELNEFGETVELHDFDNVHYQKFDSWYVLIGKTIFCHPVKFVGRIPGGTVDAMRVYFQDRYGSEEFDSIVCAHTHRQYKGVVGEKLLIEQGAMCTRMPYQHKPNLRHKHSVAGYAVIYQDMNGNTCFNDSNFVYLGSHLPPKKELL
jgi:predicted phosphodiesterase